MSYLSLWFALTNSTISKNFFKNARKIEVKLNSLKQTVR